MPEHPKNRLQRGTRRLGNGKRLGDHRLGFFLAAHRLRRFGLHAPFRDPRGPASGSERVVRGGDYESELEFLRTFDRDPWPPSTRKDFIGFRCARSAP